MNKPKVHITNVTKNSISGWFIENEEYNSSKNKYEEIIAEDYKEITSLINTYYLVSAEID